MEFFVAVFVLAAAVASLAVVFAQHRNEEIKTRNLELEREKLLDHASAPEAAVNQTAGRDAVNIDNSINIDRSGHS